MKCTNPCKKNYQHVVDNFKRVGILAECPDYKKKPKLRYDK